jgi:ATP-dependent exoDNAse (exonuclease V) beta subunit
VVVKPALSKRDDTGQNVRIRAHTLKVRAERVYRERDFIWNDGGVIVQGKPDLLLIEPDGVTVVDYKLSGRSPEYLKARYADQLEIYARAAAAITGKPVKGTYIYHIDTGRLI